jgi:hypothetical protein
VCGAVVARLRAEEVDALVEDGRLVEAAGGGLVLCAADMVEATAAEDAPAGGAWVFGAAGRVARRPAGRGFELLARAVAQGRGPLTLRGVAAGVRLIEDAEQATRVRGLTMDWSGGVSDRRARGPKDGGMSEAARAANKSLTKVRAALAPDAWRIAWLACVERMTIAAIARETGAAPRTVRLRLARALEQLADAYDG